MKKNYMNDPEWPRALFMNGSFGLLYSRESLVFAKSSFCKKFSFSFIILHIDGRIADSGKCSSRKV